MNEVLKTTNDFDVQNVQKSTLFRKKVDAAATACEKGDFQEAIRLYNETVSLDPANHVLYSNRSAIQSKLKQFELALHDANKAIQIKPDWPKGYVRQGHALQAMAQHTAALLAFATGLVHDSKNQALLTALVDCVRLTHLADRFNTVYSELKHLGLDRSPFVLVSLIGQEMLAANELDSAVRMLQLALTIGTTSLKLRQSVLSALSSAKWKQGDTQAAAQFMRLDLQTAVELGDLSGQARAHNNLGMLHTAMHKEQDAIEHYKLELKLRLQIEDETNSMVSLAVIGHLNLRKGQLVEAREAYEQCRQLMGCEAETGPADRVLALIGVLSGLAQIDMQTGDLDTAESELSQARELAESVSSHVELARVTCQLGRVFYKRRDWTGAQQLFRESLTFAKSCQDRLQQAMAIGQLCLTAQALEDWTAARKYAEKELQIALALKDKSIEAAACGHLGNVYEQCGEHSCARRLYQKHVEFAQKAGDERSVCMAHGNLARCALHLALHNQAMQHANEQLRMAEQMNDRLGQFEAHGVLAELSERTEQIEQALTHHQMRLTVAVDQTCTLSALAALAQHHMQYTHVHMHNMDNEHMIEQYLSRYLMLAQEACQPEAERHACELLGQMHFNKQRYPESVRYFEQELSIAKDSKNFQGMASAYSWLGRAHLKVHSLEEALECQKYFLALSHIASNLPDKISAMKQIAETLLARGDHSTSVKVLGKALKQSEQLQPSTKRVQQEQAHIYLLLADVYLQMGRHDKANTFYSQSLILNRQLQCVEQQILVHGRLAMLNGLRGNFSQQLTILNEQLRLINNHKSLAEVQNGDAESDCLFSLSSAFEMNGDLVEAAKHCSQAIDLVTERGTTDEAICEQIYRLAELYGLIGLYGTCLAQYKRYVTMFTVTQAATNNQLRLSLVYSRIGQLYLHLCQPAFCAKYSEEALQMMTNCAVDVQLKLSVWRCLAAASVAQAEHDRALHILAQRLQFVRRLALHREELDCLRDMVYVHMHKGDYKAAREWAAQRLDLAQDTNQHSAKYDTLLQMATIEQANESFSAAHILLTQIVDANQPIDKATVDAHIELGMSAILQGDHNLSTHHLDTAVNVATQMCLWHQVNRARMCKVVLNWMVDQIQTALTESMLVVCEWSETDVVEDCLQFGNVGHIRAATWALQMLIYAQLGEPVLALLAAENITRYRTHCSMQIHFAESIGHSQSQSFQPTTETELTKIIELIKANKQSLLFRFDLAGICSCVWILENGADLEVLVCDELDEQNESDSAQSVDTRMDWSQSALDRGTLLSCLRVVILDSHLMTDMHIVQQRVQNRMCSQTTSIVQSHASFSRQLLHPARDRHSLCHLVPSLTSGPQTIEPSPTQTHNFVCAPRNQPSLDFVASILKCAKTDCEGLGPDDLLSELATCSIAHLQLNLTDNCAELILNSDENVRLTCSQIVQHRLNCRLVTLVTCDASRLWTPDTEPCANLAHVVRCLHLAGAHHVLLIIQSATNMDNRVTNFLSSVYKNLQQEGPSDNQLNQLVQGCIESEQVLASANVLLYGQVTSQPSALPATVFSVAAILRTILQAPDECREAMRMMLHLIEKSIQRIELNQDNPRYTMQQSIKTRVGPEVNGWLDLLLSVGFECGSLPSQAQAPSVQTPLDQQALYFPTSEHLPRLHSVSKALKALIGLPQTSLLALSQFEQRQQLAVNMLATLNRVSSELAVTKGTQLETCLSKEIFQEPCSQKLMSSLGFDFLLECDQGMLVKTIRIELTKRKLQLVIEALQHLFSDSTTLTETVTSGRGTLGRKVVSYASNAAHIPLKDLAITDMSGIDSDNGLCMFDTARKQPKTARRTKNKQSAQRTAGYASESEARYDRVQGTKGFRQHIQWTGYHSEDDPQLHKQNDLHNSVKVLSVDQTDSALDPHNPINQSAIDSDQSAFDMNNSIHQSTIDVAQSEHDYGRLETPLDENCGFESPQFGYSQSDGREQIYGYGSDVENIRLAARKLTIGQRKDI